MMHKPPERRHQPPNRLFLLFGIGILFLFFVWHNSSVLFDLNARSPQHQHQQHLKPTEYEHAHTHDTTKANDNVKPDNSHHNQHWHDTSSLEELPSSSSPPTTQPSNDDNNNNNNYKDHHKSTIDHNNIEEEDEDDDDKWIAPPTTTTTTTTSRPSPSPSPSPPPTKPKQPSPRSKKARGKPHPEPLPPIFIQPPSQPPMPPATSKTAVIFIYHGLNTEHDASLDYFSKIAIQKDDNVDYYVVDATPEDVRRQAFPVRGGDGGGGLVKQLLPVLGATMVSLPQELNGSSSCSSKRLKGNTWTVLGSVLRHHQPPIINLSSSSDTTSDKIKYVVVVDSYALGPFVPPSVRGHMHWTTAFTAPLRDSSINKVGMVGAMINCEGAPLDGKASGEWRKNPFIVRHAWAATSEVIKSMIQDATTKNKNNGIFDCYSTEWDVKYYSDAGASAFVLAQGLNLASHMLRYAGVDWRDKRNWGCNGGVRPFGIIDSYDGHIAGPYETMFSFGSLPAQALHSADFRPPLQIAKWQALPVNITNNGYANVTVEAHNQKAERIVPLLTYKGGAPCFDTDHYMKENGEIEETVGTYGCLGFAQLFCGFNPFEHFALIGQFAGKAHRWLCPAKIAGVEEKRRMLGARGRGCFDAGKYRAMMAEQQHLELESDVDAWRHFLDNIAGLDKDSNSSSSIVEELFVCSETAQVGLVEGVGGVEKAELVEELKKELSIIANPFIPLTERERDQMRKRKEKEGFYNATDAKVWHSKRDGGGAHAAEEE